MALQEFKCPNCGGPIEYKPGTREMACPYCDTTIDVDALLSLDRELHTEQESEARDFGYEGAEWSESERSGLAVYTCRSCAGEIVGEETLGATSCPFCGNTVVITSKFAGTFRPDLVIPFAHDKDAALAALKKHYLNKRLLPKVFKAQNHLDEIKGVYVPFWLYDADVDAKVSFNATKVRSWSTHDYDYIETETYRVYRAGGIGFNTVPVDGSSAVDNTLMESIEPFPLSAAVDFQTAYLAGYFANKYDVDAGQCSPRAHERMKNSAQAAFRDTVTGYTTVTPIDAAYNLKSGDVKYALFPVWLLATSWEGKNFLFAMNGHTGSFVGNLPLDKAALVKWIFIVFGISAAACFLISLVVTMVM